METGAPEAGWVSAKSTPRAPINRVVVYGAYLLAALLLFGLAIAPPAGAGTIARAKLDGTGVDRSFIITASSPSGLAVDGAHIYWDSEDAIGRANRDGTALNESFIATGGESHGLAVDGAHIYWTSGRFTSPLAIGRANPDGSGVDPSFIVQQAPWSQYYNFMSDVAVGDTHIYWVTGLLSLNGAEAKIARANLDGSGVEKFIDQPFAFIDGAAVDGAHIYWTTSGGIGRANLDGTGVDPSFISVRGSAVSAVAVDGAHVYWSSNTGIGRANLDGSGFDPGFITDPCATYGGLAVDGAYLYWSSLEPPPPGAKRFSFGKVKRNARKGTAKLAVKVGGGGEVFLAKTKRVKGVEKRIEEAGRIMLPIRPKGAAKQRLATEGRARVEAKIAYWPAEADCGQQARTKSRKVTLIKRG